jgi:hypothetical protein
MTMKRRDLLLGGGVAASVAAVGLSAEAKAQTTPWPVSSGRIRTQVASLPAW